mgnify:CR=1 FL=1
MNTFSAFFAALFGLSKAISRLAGVVDAAADEVERRSGLVDRPALEVEDAARDNGAAVKARGKIARTN